jgi:hypothetical protein
LKPRNPEARVRAITSEALTACDLDPTGTVPTGLDQPGQQTRRAAAAAVLATAIIKVPYSTQLRALYLNLMGAGHAAAHRELRTVLTYGDEIHPRSHPRLVLKNFACAGRQSRSYRRQAVRAYDEAERLLMRMHAQFTGRVFNSRFSFRTIDAFRKYFGECYYIVDPRTLDWAREFTWDKPFEQDPRNAVHPRPSHMRIVLTVLRRIHTVFFRNDPIRLYFGGKSVYDANIGAYTRVGSERPTRIHLGSTFFGRTALVQGETLIHEMSHAWSFCRDHAVTSGNCARLALTSPGKALTNADNYAYFITEAFS